MASTKITLTYRNT